MKNLIFSVAVSAIAAGSANAGVRMVDQEYKIPLEKAVASPVVMPAVKAASAQTSVAPLAQPAPVAVPQPKAPVAQPTPQKAPETAQTPVLRPMEAPMPVAVPLAIPMPVQALTPAPSNVPVASANVQTVPRAQPARPAIAPGYGASKADNTIREVLVRWSAMSGWAHDPEHWAVEKDHPIEGNAGPEVFGIEFKSAVRILLASTENSDLPVQPCFYTNRVLRVIAKAATCDRSTN
jgi:hypothetical protein